MKILCKRVIALLFAAIVSVAGALAQSLTARVYPQQAEVGQRVQLSYTLNSSDYDRIKLDGEIQNFDVLYGPSVSSSSSISIINGKTTQSSSTTFTYVLRAKKEGTFTLPAATINCEGKQLRSNQAKVNILPATDRSQSQQQQQQQGYGGYSGQQRQQQSQSNRFHTPSSSERINPSDLYFTVTASKKHVYEQEAILLTYKLYSMYNIDQITGEIPQLDGFHTQEIELPQQRSFTMEHVNGKNYGTVVWRQYVLFPQKAGTLTIPAIDYETDVVVQETSDDIFEAFFGGGSVARRVKKIVKAPAVQIQVDALPTKPANFSGAVGKGFTITGKLSPEQVDANDATQLTLTLRGTGNMKLISAPAVEWPKDFESYDAKVNENTKLTTGGLSGTITYEYQAVPHHAGKYDIPAVEFCYFDTDSHQYKTIKTEPFNLGVAPGMGRSTSTGVKQEEVQDLGNDIRYVKTSPIRFRKDDATLWGSVGLLLIYLGLVALFVIILLIFRRQAKANANVGQRRGRKAGKAAAKRLKAASKLMQKGDAGAFYDEVMRALWGYVADKLNLPIADLTKDNVSEKLQAKGVSEASTEKFLNVLGECEFARFAPGDPASNMEHLYDVATEVIDELDGML